MSERVGTFHRALIACCVLFAAILRSLAQGLDFDRAPLLHRSFRVQPFHYGHVLYKAFAVVTCVFMVASSWRW